jgi:zinc transport system ATP-binding protein
MTPAIEARDLWVSFRGWNALEAVSLVVAPGEFLGLIGPNGAGKTVLLRTLLGLVRPDRGTVRILGHSPEHARGRVAYVPQSARFDRDFPVRALDVVLAGRLGRNHLLRRYDRGDRERAARALEQVGLADHAERQIGRLSGGQLQRVLVARALAVDAEVLLLDEPASSLDPESSGQLYGLLSALSRGGMTVVLVDHDVGVVYRHVQTVACLNRRLFYHGAGSPSHQELERAYGFPLEVVVHDHRLLDPHRSGESH